MAGDRILVAVDGLGGAFLASGNALKAFAAIDDRRTPAWRMGFDDNRRNRILGSQGM